MEKISFPTKQGQICKAIKPLTGDNPEESYIVTADVSQYSEDAIIYVVSITDLQRNIANPALAPRRAFAKNELAVVANDLQSFVESWNR